MLINTIWINHFISLYPSSIFRVGSPPPAADELPALPQVRPRRSLPPRRQRSHGEPHRRDQGCNSIDVFLGPESGPEPLPSHFWSFETCPSTESGPELDPVSRPVLYPKFIISIELTPRGVADPIVASYLRETVHIWCPYKWPLSLCLYSLVLCRIWFLFYSDSGSF